MAWQNEFIFLRFSHERKYSKNEREKKRGAEKRKNQTNLVF